MDKKISFFWFRRDLRLEDNHGLWEALKGDAPVLPVFIFDTNILEKLPAKDARVTFLHHEIENLKKKLQNAGGDLLVEYGKPLDVWEKLIQEYKPKALYTNHDYEPYARERDSNVQNLCKKSDISFHTFKDQVVFEKDEVLKDDGNPYTVYTPYSKKWKETLTPADLSPFESEKELTNLFQTKTPDMPSLEDMGFKDFSQGIPPKETPTKTLKTYNQTRDIPKLEDGTSRLGIHLRFGTISIRKLMKEAQTTNGTYFNELIWREFFQQILWYFPKVEDHSFREKYDAIDWINDEQQFQKWCEGKTGFPIVDAGMRELNETGYMHNRVRMITASFLCKDLLIDWRWGERYFAEKLLDYDLAANNGGWQWAAGTGCDAAPYFRVFNPDSQQEKFDPDFEYINRWVPEYGTDDYPEPMVNHKEARIRALETYKKALK